MVVFVYHVLAPFPYIKNNSFSLLTLKAEHFASYMYILYYTRIWIAPIKKNYIIGFKNEVSGKYIQPNRK